MRKIIGLLLIFLMLASPVMYADEMITVAPKDITVTYNGETIPFPDAAPLIQNGKTLVPVRPIMERADLSVSFDNIKKTVTAQNDDITIMMTIDDSVATVITEKSKKRFLMEEPARIINGYTYVPVRFIAEALGTKVNWNPVSREVVIIDIDEWKKDIKKASPFIDLLLNMPTDTVAYAGDFSAEFQYAYKAKDMEPIDINISLVGTCVYDGVDTGYFISVDTDLTFLKDRLSRRLNEEELAIVCKPCTIDLDIFVDEQKNIYVKSNRFLSFLREIGRNETADLIGDKYIKFTLDDLSEPGIDLSFITHAEDSTETRWEELETRIANDPYLYTHSVRQLDSLIDLYGNLYPDESFYTNKQTGSEFYRYTSQNPGHVDALLNLAGTYSRGFNFPTSEAVLLHQQEHLTDKKAAVSMEVNFNKNLPLRAELALAVQAEDTEHGSGAKLSQAIFFGMANHKFDPKQDRILILPQNVITLGELDAK